MAHLIRSAGRSAIGRAPPIASTSALPRARSALCRATPRRAVVLLRHQSTSTPKSALRYLPPHVDVKPALDASGCIPRAPYDASPLQGSVGEHHTHLILVPSSNAREIKSWPSHLASVSPLIAELESRCKKEASLSGSKVNFAVPLDEAGGEVTAPRPAREWDAQTSQFVRPAPGGLAEEEEYELRIYTSGKMAVLGPISLLSLDKPAPLAKRIEKAIAAAPVQSARQQATDNSDVFVCLHGSRDCRCAAAGGEFVERLAGELQKHRARVQAEGGTVKEVKLWGISHVGGHKWAANAIVQPAGDWYGNLRPTDAPLILRSALAPPTSFHDLEDARERLVHWPRWRGRMGPDEQQTVELYDEWGPPVVSSATITPRARLGAAPAAGGAAAPAGTAASSSTAPVASPEVMLRFVTYEGEEHSVPSKVGESVKDAAKRANMPSIEATCGGVCECATCHAYFVSPLPSAPSTAPPSERYSLAIAPPERILGEAAQMKDEELDMLDYAIGRKEASRLCCQVKVTSEMVEWMEKEGGRVLLPRF